MASHYSTNFGINRYSILEDATCIPHDIMQYVTVYGVTISR